MKSILFVFTSSYSMEKYLPIISKVKDYGYVPDVVLLTEEVRNEAQVDKEYQLIFSDDISLNQTYLSIKNMTIEDIISDINTFCCV